MPLIKYKKEKEGIAMKAVLMPVTGKAAESLKSLLEKPSVPNPLTEEQIQNIFERAHMAAIENDKNEVDQIK